MKTIARVLNVFLASPDDVKDERIAAEEVVSDVDKIIGKALGWNIRLYKWEDMPPASGRPQEIINAAVDNCDLFIGLLWERWGQPSGDYSSGFEEEYERARSRRKTTERPELWLVFKTIEPGKLKDPGTQLAKVVEFRQKVSNERGFLYKEANDLDDWRRKLRNWLDEYILNLHAVASQPAHPPDSVPEPGSLTAPESESVVTPKKRSKVPPQLLEMAESITQVVESGELEFSREDAKLLQEFDVARLFLLSATWMFRRYTGDTLGTHEVNLLYKHRTDLQITPAELLQLFRALLVDINAVTPGWFWFSNLKAETLRNSLLSISTRDSSDEVRRRALQLLRSGELKLPKRLWPALPLGDSDPLVRTEACEYLGFVGDDSIRNRLEEIANTDNTVAGTAARDARLSILFRLRPAETVTGLIQRGEYINDKQISELEPILVDVEDEVLFKGTESQWEPIRRMSIRELARRGSLSAECAKKFTEDLSVPIRQIAFLELARRGNKLEFEKVRKSLSNEDTSRSSWKK